MLRGGGWNSNPHNTRAANRNRNPADNRNNNLGFRLARTPKARTVQRMRCTGAQRGVQG